jgi:branched-subunit amino acid aminotransferase/4-amino-4-deoxychorismate lyase
VDEAFLTSSSRGIVPIIKIDDVTIGQGSPGQTTRQLMAAYETHVIENAEKIL